MIIEVTRAAECCTGTVKPHEPHEPHRPNTLRHSKVSSALDTHSHGRLTLHGNSVIVSVAWAQPLSWLPRSLRVTLLSRTHQWLRLALASFCLPLIWLARVVYLTYVEATVFGVGMNIRCDVPYHYVHLRSHVDLFEDALEADVRLILSEVVIISKTSNRCVSARRRPCR